MTRQSSGDARRRGKKIREKMHKKNSWPFWFVLIIETHRISLNVHKYKILKSIRARKTKHNGSVWLRMA